MPLSRRRTVTAFAAVSALLAGGVAARAKFKRYYDGPVSDHFDGTTFIDPNGTKPKGLTDILRWWASNGAAKWPDRAPGFTDTPPQRVTEGLRISYVGHASLLLQTAERGMTAQDLDQAMSNFSRLQPETARRVLGFYRTRRKPQPPPPTEAAE